MTTPVTTYSQSRWSLGDLFPSPDSPALQAAFDRLDQAVTEFESLRPKLTDDISTADFLAIVARIEQLQEEASRLYAFAGLLFTEDTQDQVAQGLTARVEQFVADLTNRTLFFNLWWKDLPEEEGRTPDGCLRRLTATGWRRCAISSPSRSASRKKRSSTSRTSPAPARCTTLYNSITNRYTFKVKVDGEEQGVTRGELMVYARQADADLRAQPTRSSTASTARTARSWARSTRPWCATGATNRSTCAASPAPFPRATWPTTSPTRWWIPCWMCAQKNAGLFQRFFKLKARLLEMESLRRYDIYAPVTHSDKKFAFSHAAELVLDSFEQFDPRFAAMALRVFNENHVDSEVRKGKRGGAFCGHLHPT